MTHHFRGHRSTAGHCFAKAEMPVRFRLAAPFDASVADTERHLSCKQVHVGAKPTGGPISDASHGVIAAPLLVKETAPGRNRLGSPISSCAWRRSRASGLQVHLTRCESGAHVHLSSRMREPANSPALEAGEARGSTGVRDQFRFRGVRVLHTAVRRQRLEVQVLAEAPFQTVE